MSTLAFRGADEADTLFDMAPLVEPEGDAHLTIAERFAAFHAANPWVYRALEHLAADWIARSQRHFGIKTLVELVRHTYDRDTTGDHGFRINNDFTAHYARMLIEDHPELEGVMRTRRLRAA